MGFGRELSVRPSVRVSELVELLSVRLSSRGSTELAERPKSHAARLSVRVSELVELLSSRGSTELAERPKSRRTSEVSPNVRSLAERPKSHAEVRTGVGFYPFSGRSAKLSRAVVNYLIFREKIPKFSPQSLQW